MTEQEEIDKIRSLTHDEQIEYLIEMLVHKNEIIVSNTKYTDGLRMRLTQIEQIASGRAVLN